MGADDERVEVTEIIGKCGCILRAYSAGAIILDEMLCKDHQRRAYKSVMNVIADRLKRPEPTVAIQADVHPAKGGLFL